LIPNATYETADTEIEGAQRHSGPFVYDFPFNVLFYGIHVSDQLIFLDEPFTIEPIARAIRKNDLDLMKF
jgi:polar amino acid transport system substrate-binding protein